MIKDKPKANTKKKITGIIIGYIQGINDKSIKLVLSSGSELEFQLSVKFRLWESFSKGDLVEISFEEEQTSTTKIVKDVIFLFKE